MSLCSSRLKIRWPLLTFLACALVHGSAGAGIRVDGVEVSTLQEAFDRAKAGSRVELDPGIYGEAGTLEANEVTLSAFGATLDGVAVKGKAALVIKGDGVTIRGLGCRGISVPDGNGACVRLEGRGLVLERVHFSDSESGLLAGNDPGLVVVRQSLFENLGHRGRAHALYVGGGELYIEDSLFLAARSQAHEVKSGARRTVIRNSVIASLDSDDSRLIDAYAGGELIISDTVLQEGRRSRNWDLIGHGLEKRRRIAGPLVTRITGSLFIVDAKKAKVVNLADGGSLVAERNVLVGSASDGDKVAAIVLSARNMAGLPPYPELDSELVRRWMERTGLTPEVLKYANIGR